jgi:hypothetical protein
LPVAVRELGKQFNGRSVGVLDRVQYPIDVIALGCRGEALRALMRALAT